MVCCGVLCLCAFYNAIISTDKMLVQCCAKHHRELTSHAITMAFNWNSVTNFAVVASLLFPSPLVKKASPQDKIMIMRYLLLVSRMLSQACMLY